MQFMKSCDDNQFDLAIVDPPYGINVAKKGFVGGYNKTPKGKTKILKSTAFTPKNWDAKPPALRYFEELIRISKNQIIWGGNYFMHMICRGSSCWIVWDKNNGKTSFADCELAYTSFKTSVRRFRFTWNGMIQGDMKNKELRIHPTQKPVALYEWLLSKYAKVGDSILDTHMGSGSIAIATNKHGFDLTACELDKDYFESACERIKKEYNQPDMFTSPVSKPEQGVLL